MGSPGRGPNADHLTPTNDATARDFITGSCLRRFGRDANLRRQVIAVVVDFVFQLRIEGGISLRGRHHAADAFAVLGEIHGLRSPFGLAKVASRRLSGPKAGGFGLRVGLKLDLHVGIGAFVLPLEFGHRQIVDLMATERRQRVHGTRAVGDEGHAVVFLDEIVLGVGHVQDPFFSRQVIPVEVERILSPIGVVGAVNDHDGFLEPVAIAGRYFNVDRDVDRDVDDATDEKKPNNNRDAALNIGCWDRTGTVVRVPTWAPAFFTSLLVNDRNCDYIRLMKEFVAARPELCAGRSLTCVPIPKRTSRS